MRRSFMQRRMVPRVVSTRAPAGEGGLAPADARAGLPRFLHGAAAPGSGPRPRADGLEAPLHPAVRRSIEGASGGTPLPEETRHRMESRFGADFSGVRVHADRASGAVADALGADALATGRALFFGAGRYRPGTPAGDRLLAHELAHVVQQRAGGDGAGARALGRPGDAAERGADRAADAVARGQAAGEVGSAPAGVVQRAVSTSGGEWDTVGYAARNVGAGAGKGVGADITVHFTPNDLVEADTIGLVQSVKTLRASTRGGSVDDPSYTDPTNQAVSLQPGEGDVGRAIDQIATVPGKTLPQTSPLYAVGNRQVPDPADATKTIDTVSVTLTDVAPDPANHWGQHGAHTRTAGVFNPPVDATLEDHPSRTLAFAGQEWRQSFEVAALVLDGPMAGTYLGSIAWGWQVDSTETATVTPSPISVVRAGAPSSEFMAAARKWNQATFTDTATGKTYDSVDLPITFAGSGGVSPAKLSTSQLVLRIAEVTNELGVIGSVGAIQNPLGGGPLVDVTSDRKSKELEKRALEAELARRGDQPTVPLAARTATAAALTTRAIVARLGVIAADLPATPTGAARTDLELEKHALEDELRRRSLKLAVTVHETEDIVGSDSVYATVTLGGRSFTSEVHDLNNGQSHDFAIPLASLLPAVLPPTDDFIIRLYDEDWEGDDLMLSESWSAPYSSHRAIQSRDGGKYEVLIDFDR